MKELEIRLLSLHAVIPTRANENDAGLDLYASEDMEINCTAIVPTGIAVNIPQGYVGLIWPKSGLSAKHGIDVLAGVIDAGYTGEVKVCLLYANGSPPTHFIKRGDKIAQLLIQKIKRPKPISVIEFSNLAGDRGENGFGSSGK